MKPTQIIIATMLTMLSAGLCHASEEGLLPLSTLTAESAGIGKSGPISVIARKDNSNQWIEVTISAFGKEFSLNEDQRKQLDGEFVNGLMLSYEEGYEDLGGRTVYIIFIRGFSSGIKMRQLVSIAENGTISITDPRK